MTSILRIGQLNAQNSRAATAEIRKIMQDYDIHIMTLQEPYSIDGQIKGMGLDKFVIGNQEGNTRPMAAIVTQGNMYPPLELSQYKTTHFSSIQIKSNGDDLLIISGYFQHGHEIAPYVNHLTRILNEKRGGRTLLCLDANAKSNLWFNSETNDRGSALEDFINDQDLLILNQNGQPPTHSAGNNIDVTLVTTNLHPHFKSWRVLPSASCSDHHLIIIELSTNISKTISRCYITKGANYQMINAKLRENLARRIPSINPNDKANQLQSAMIETCEECLKKKTSRRKSVPWWSPILSDLKLRLNRSRRRAQRVPQGHYRNQLMADYRRLKREYKTTIRNQKSLTWKRFAAENSNEDPFGIAYKVSSEKITKRDHFNSVRRNDGSLTHTLHETLHAIFDSILPGDMQATDTPIQAEIRDSYDATPDGLAMGPTPLFTNYDLKAALDKAKSGRASGPDKIPIEVLKNLDEDNQEILLDVYNELLMSSTFPDPWKSSLVRIIRKGGNRDWTLPKSYRPISLISTLGKTFERLLVERITEHIQSHCPLNENQHGFVKGKSTISALDCMMRAIGESNSKHVILVALDIGGAFDTLWWPYLLMKLRERSLPYDLYSILRSYLSNRKLILEVNDDQEERTVSLGCPQGSVIGPLMWNLVVDELLSLVLPPNTSLIAFADDITLLVEANSRAGLENTFHETWRSIALWAERAKLTFSKDKTKAIQVKGNLERRTPVLRMDQQNTVTFKKTIKILGFTLDSKLNFLDHAKHAADKAKKLVYKIHRAIRLKYGVKRRSYNLIYNAVYVPIVCYGAPVWQHRADNAHVKRTLRSSQGSVLRSKIGAYRTLSFMAATVLNGAPPIELVIKERAQIQSLKQGRIATTRSEIERATNDSWQNEWDTAITGRYTYEILPNIRRYKELQFNINHVSTQYLTGHGCFGSYLHRFGKRPAPFCTFCGPANVEETPHHLFFDCPKYQLSENRNRLMTRTQELQLTWPVTFREIIEDETLSKFSELLMLEIIQDSNDN